MGEEQRTYTNKHISDIGKDESGWWKDRKCQQEYKWRWPKTQQVNKQLSEMAHDLVNEL
jgi:hypothetical protein